MPQKWPFDFLDSTNTPKCILIFVCGYKSFRLKIFVDQTLKKKKKVSTFFLRKFFEPNPPKKKKGLNFFFEEIFIFLGAITNKRSQIFQKNPPKWLHCPHNKKYHKTTVLSWRQKTPQNDCFVLKAKNTPKRLLILGGIFQKKKKQ